MKFRGRYNVGDDERVRELTRTRNDEPTKTERHHARNCDLNVILRQYGVGKSLPVLPYSPDMFGEDDLDLDLHGALAVVQGAQDYFNALPSSLRAKFSYSPAALWDWVNDPANADEAVNLGLLKRYDPTPATPPPAAVANQHSAT